MKRFLALILAVAMSVMWLLVPVQAVRTSGTCGENIMWSYDETSRRLTVTGTGPMEIEDFPEWWDVRSKITSVVIEEGVTAVGRNAFNNCTALHTVTLPESVTIIGDHAFYYCLKLKNISLENITQLGNSAFYRCNSLKELIVPEGVTEIPGGAFSDCGGLQRVVFHENVKSIGSNAFRFCTGLTSITIPDSVTTIEHGAFSSCKNLVSVDLGKGVTVLSNAVFDTCSKLESIRLPDSVTQIQSNALNSCALLKEVYLGAGVSDVAVDAFQKDPMLKAFTVSEQNPYLSVDRGVLYTKDRTELLLFPYGFTGAYTVLPGTIRIQTRAAYETGITALTLPDSVRTVGKYAFDGCENLVSLRLNEGLEKLEPNAFAYTGLQKVVIPASVTTIGQQTFTGCIGMKQMVIYGEPPTIQELAFPRVEFSVFYPKRTAQWLDAHDLYGGLPSWELQCTTHSFVDGACGRCGVSDPRAGELTGAVTVAGNDYAVTQVQVLAEGQTEPLRTYTVPVGDYLFPEILPGNYILRIGAEGYVSREYAIQVVHGTVMQDICLQSMGDTNGDGKMNMGDFSALYAHVKRTAVLSGYTLECADFDGNGAVNMGDVAGLYAKIRNGD